jgi:hypothetical protein
VSLRCSLHAAFECTSLLHLRGLRLSALYAHPTHSHTSSPARTLSFIPVLSSASHASPLPSFDTPHTLDGPASPHQPRDATSSFMRHIPSRPTHHGSGRRNSVGERLPQQPFVPSLLPVNTRHTRVGAAHASHRNKKTFKMSPPRQKTLCRDVTTVTTTSPTPPVTP